ncbi:MAG: Peptidase inhibitor family [Pseudomonas sp.]|nr:Peptidase inhibitor family [Pseudomonas sp.]
MNNEDVVVALQHLVGSRYVPTVKAYIGELTGRARVVGPKDMTTREFDPERVHIAVDTAGNISTFHFN